jgi:hypothetical protein
MKNLKNFIKFSGNPGPSTRTAPASPGQTPASLGPRAAAALHGPRIASPARHLARVSPHPPPRTRCHHRIHSLAVGPATSLTRVLKFLCRWGEGERDKDKGQLLFPSSSMGLSFFKKEIVYSTINRRISKLGANKVFFSKLHVQNHIIEKEDT